MAQNLASSDSYVEDIDCTCLLRPCGRLALMLRARGLDAWNQVVHGFIMCSLTHEDRWLFVAVPPGGSSHPPVVVGRTSVPLSPLFDAVFALLSLQARGDLFVLDAARSRSAAVVDHYLVVFADHDRALVYLEGLEQASLDV